MPRRCEPLVYWLARISPMPTTKKPKTEKKPLTTAEFIEQVNKQDVKRNGLKIRFGFTKNQR